MKKPGDTKSRIVKGNVRRYKEQIYQLVKFCIVGIGNTLVSICVTYTAIFILKRFFNAYSILSLNLCTTLGYILGVLNSFFWNKKYVFKNSHEEVRKTLAKTFVCYGITYIISLLIMNFFVEFCGLPKVIAPILRLIVTIPINFIANKFWAYRDYRKG